MRIKHCWTVFFVLLFGALLVASDKKLKLLSTVSSFAAYWIYRMEEGDSSISFSTPLPGGFENAVNISLVTKGSDSVKLYATICRNRQFDVPSIGILSDEYSYAVLRPSSLIPYDLRCDFNISEPLLHIRMKSNATDNFGILGVSVGEPYNISNSGKRMTDSKEQRLKLNETMILPYFVWQRLDIQIIVLKGELSYAIHGLCRDNMYENFSVGSHTRSIVPTETQDPRCKDPISDGPISLVFYAVRDDSIVRIVTTYADGFPENNEFTILQILAIALLITILCLLLGIVAFCDKKDLQRRRYEEQRQAAMKEATNDGNDGVFTSEIEPPVIVLNGKPPHKNPAENQLSAIEVTTLTEIPLETKLKPRISAFNSTKL